MVTAPPALSLYEGVRSALHASLAARYEALFDEHCIYVGENHYNVGRIIKSAWKAEYALPPGILESISSLISSILKEPFSGIERPSCCRFHKDKIFGHLSDHKIYSPDIELLPLLAELIGCTLPNSRASLRMLFAIDVLSITNSRFMSFKNFIKQHVLAYDGSKNSINYLMKHYTGIFSPLENAEVRQNKIKSSTLPKKTLAPAIIGMVGAHSTPDPDNLLVSNFCKFSRPFSTPSKEIDDFDKNEPPDRLLQALGIDFDQDVQYIEMKFDVEISPDDGSAPNVPNVIDAGWNWLFQPDRDHASDETGGGFLWNYTRDITTNARGRKELISRPVPVAKLVDLIVWPKPTAGNWATGAAAALSSNIAVP